MSVSPQARAARPFQRTEVHSAVGLKIKALRRFDRDGFLGIGVKGGAMAR